MLIQPVDYFMVVCFALAAAWWRRTTSQQSRAQRDLLGLHTVTLYAGQIVLPLYVMADKETHPGNHERFVKPLCKQGVNSTLYIIAGDSTGIILAAVIPPRWADVARPHRLVHRRPRVWAPEHSQIVKA